MCIWGVLKCGYPNNWLVYFMENPKIKWMMNRGTPILGNLHIYTYIYIYIHVDFFVPHTSPYYPRFHPLVFITIFPKFDGHLGGHIQTIRYWVRCCLIFLDIMISLVMVKVWIRELLGSWSSSKTWIRCYEPRLPRERLDERLVNCYKESHGSLKNINLISFKGRNSNRFQKILK